VITVWKFEVPFVDEPEVVLPRHAEVLHFGAQDGRLYIWARVDTEGVSFGARRFRLAGTGHELGVYAMARHVGTVYVPPLVWHLFEGRS
jgi:hypothetical protein